MHGIIGVIQNDGQLLVIQRSANVRAPLAWCFPGGEIEYGETHEQALIREMQEEILVEVAPGRLLMTQSKHGCALILHCWSATIVRGTPTPNPSEIANLRWLTPAQIRTQPGLLPGTADILDELGL